MIEIIPAIDIIEGRCVRLTKGNYATKKVYDASPLEMAKQYADCGVKRIHMVDLDGAKHSSPFNLKTLEEVASKADVEIEWGGGIYGDESLSSVFNAGATQAIIGSIAALRPSEFTKWLKIFGSERILLGSDVNNGAVSIKGWQHQTALTIDEQIGWFLEDGLRYVICTDISCDGMLEGPSFLLYETLMAKFPDIIFTASGGIGGMDDIRALNQMGVPKVVVGKAIYENRISLEDIRKWSQNA